MPEPREVVVERDARRDFICERGHVWEVVGETTWNPWGPPNDWRPRVGTHLDCPTCGARGSRAVTVNPDMLPML